MSGPDDSSLVAAAVTGDGAAYGELFALYEKRIYNYAYGILGNKEDAADVAQDAFVRVFQALPGKDASLNFSAYLYRTTHNLAMDAIKQRNRFAAPDALDLAQEPALRADPEKVALLAEQQEQAWEATAKLSESHRSVLALRELHDMSYQEIADVMEMPRTTVGVTLSRARIKFKEAFRMSSIDIDKLAEECQTMLPLLSAYMDDELQQGEQEALLPHLDECAFCQLALEEMTEASKSYRAIVPLVPPAGLGEGVRAKLADMLSPEEAYALERSLDEALQEPGVGSARSKSSKASWIVKATVVIVGAMLLALAGAGAVGEFVPSQSERLQSALAPEATTERVVQAPPAEEAGTVTEEFEPAEEKPEETPREEAEPVGTAADDTAPPTPAQTSPSDGTLQEADSTVVLTWQGVEDPSGVLYSVDIERYDEEAGGYVAWKSVTGLPDTSLTYRTGTTAERWRVWATDGEENSSDKSGWWGIRKFVVLVPGPKTEEPPTLY
jgi:RNA polymerase sigma-70 factor (ECF subfamily)